MSKPPPLCAAINLERNDLIAFEARLRSRLARFFSFAASSLYFPGNATTTSAAYIASEKKLLLPLYEPLPGSGEGGSHTGREDGPLAEDPGQEERPRRLLGVFVARGVRAVQVKPMLPLFPAVAELVMENMALHKAGLRDPESGLFTRQSFFASAAAELRCMRHESALGLEDLSQSTLRGDARGVFTRPCLGVLAIRIHSLRDIAREYGYLFADRVMAALGETLQGMCPQQGMAARVGDYELAVLLPAFASKDCLRLALDIARATALTSVPHSLTRRDVGARASVGYALYPQDMEGGQFLKTAPEQAHILLRKARLAAAMAEEIHMPGDGNPVMGFGRIVAEGGRIVDMLPLSRVMVSLGSGVNAREGQRFSVWSRGSRGGEADGTPLYKGEIVLVDVRSAGSVAEIIHMGDPALAMERGDRLSLLPEEQDFAVRETGGGERPDPHTGLLRHGDFLARWTVGREVCGHFSLGLLRFAPMPRKDSEGAEDDGASAADQRRPEELLGDAVKLCREFFGEDVIGGRYGLTSFIFFHPEHTAEKTGALYAELAALLAARLFPADSGVRIAAGVAGYPHLNFRKADIFENCRKALEYGSLLPAPHIGVFDSLALTISADKRFSADDSFGALEEYKQALLADEGNILAWNSLGVCLAGLRRHEEARRCFEEAVARRESGQSSPLYMGQSKNDMPLYNLGYACQCLGDHAEAARHYRRCLRQNPGHIFAMLRLGQIAEREGAYLRARRLYRKAAVLPGGDSPALRHLAGLCLREGKAQEAREHLHEALSLDPRNAGALQMLARIYLDSGEDAAVAETLARQSVTLRPDRKTGWLELARALDARGLRNDAREALLRAASC